MESDLLTIKETCEKIRISESTFRRLMSANKIKAVKIGRLRFVKRQELDRFISELAA